MKLTSSVSSTTFSEIIPTTKSSVSGFLSFVRGKILHSTNLPTHQSDQLKQINPFEHQISHPMKPQQPDDSSTPCLVARLMGLDSMPETTDHKNFPSITRSKSTNDCKLEETEEELHGTILPSPQNEERKQQHRRVKTSVSFRETPTFFELEDDDFFVISFDNGGKNGKPRSRKGKEEMGGKENEQRRRRGGDRGMLKQQRPRFKFEESNTEALVLEIEKPDQAKARNRRRKKKENCLERSKVEIESESENSSPVSVLDHSLFISDQVPTSEMDTMKPSSSPRRKLASELSNIEHTTDSNNETSPKRNDQNTPKVKQTGLRRKGGRRNKRREMLNKVVRRLAGAEMEWNCEGGLMKNFKNSESDIGVELSLQIVDQLLNEVVGFLNL